MHISMGLGSISNGGSYAGKEDEDHDGSEVGKESRTESRMTNDHSNGTRNGSVENLKEDENIIPWRAQLRKTNSRLSLIG